MAPLLMMLSDPVRQTRSAWIPATTSKTPSKSTSLPPRQLLRELQRNGNTFIILKLNIDSVCLFMCFLSCVYVCVFVGKVMERCLRRSQTRMMKQWRFLKIRWRTHHNRYGAQSLRRPHTHRHTHTHKLNTATKLNHF